MNFTSQICTTKEQSERLLALGLKKETADMHYYHTVDFEGNEVWYPSIIPYENVVVASDFVGETEICLENNTIPAWSLDRLIEMMPKRLKNLKEGWDMCGHDIAFMITEDLDVNYEEPFEDYPCYNKYFHEGNLYDKIVNSISWLIKEGHFNKEYLED
ncbi:MAG: hypothetical protein UF228_07190 [Lachnospiraceae bacterium]|nr:hypothetical protein [Lachnospiraceae bacterium]